MPRITNIVQSIKATIRTRKYRRRASWHSRHDGRDRRKAQRQKDKGHLPREESPSTVLTHTVLTDTEVADFRKKWDALHTGG